MSYIHTVLRKYGLIVRSVMLMATNQAKMRFEQVHLQGGEGPKYTMT
jgi:hypothetical protein